MKSVMQDSPAFGTRVLFARAARFSSLIVVAFTAAGCWGSFNQPERLYSVQEELQPVRAAYEDAGLWDKYLAKGSADRQAFRDEIVTARMYAIDVNFTEYATRLLTESQAVDFGTGIANQALTIAAGLEPAVQTKNILTGVATGVGYVGTAYNEKILLKQSIEHVVLGMRQARFEQATVILGNLKCGVDQYPLGLALSDVELYYRAGTFESGLEKVTENVSDSTSQAKAVKQAQNPAVAPEAQAKLVANRAHAEVLAAAAPATGCNVVVGMNKARFRRGLSSK